MRRSHTRTVIHQPRTRHFDIYQFYIKLRKPHFCFLLWSDIFLLISIRYGHYYWINVYGNMHFFLLKDHQQIITSIPFFNLQSYAFAESFSREPLAFTMWYHMRWFVLSHVHQGQSFIGNCTKSNLKFVCVVRFRPLSAVPGSSLHQVSNFIC